MEDYEKLYKQLDEKQRDLLSKLEFDKEDMADLEDKLGTYLQLNCFKDSEVVGEGDLVLSILDILSNLP